MIILATYLGKIVVGFLIALAKFSIKNDIHKLNEVFQHISTNSFYSNRLNLGIHYKITRTCFLLWLWWGIVKK